MSAYLYPFFSEVKCHFRTLFRMPQVLFFDLKKHHLWDVLMRVLGTENQTSRKMGPKFSQVGCRGKEICVCKTPR